MSDAVAVPEHRSETFTLLHPPTVAVPATCTEERGDPTPVTDVIVMMHATAAS
jgi:hypothetical protein